MPHPRLTRRQLVTASLIAAAGVPAWWRPRAALASEPAGLPHRIELANTHTGECVSVVYHDGRELVPGAIAQLEHVLRDHRANEMHSIDPVLYDLLTAVALEANCDARFEVISGYRSPVTNARLAAAGAGVSTRSLHLVGRAIDVRLKGAPCTRVRDIALALARGGVGFYRNSDFVHLDTGRVRSWQG